MLTERQAEVLGLFLSGLSGRAVAQRLGLSPETINPSLKQSARKLGARGIGREKLRAAVIAQDVELPS